MVDHLLVESFKNYEFLKVHHINNVMYLVTWEIKFIYLFNIYNLKLFKSQE